MLCFAEFFTFLYVTNCLVAVKHSASRSTFSSICFACAAISREVSFHFFPLEFWETLGTSSAMIISSKYLQEMIILMQTTQAAVLNLTLWE